LPKGINYIIPNNGTSWGGESFLFEFKITSTQIEFYFTIGPGDGHTREILMRAFQTLNIENDIDPSHEYICYSWIVKEIDSIETFSHNKLEMDIYFAEFWKDVNFKVKEAEDLIDAVKEELSVIYNDLNAIK